MRIRPATADELDAVGELTVAAYGTLAKREYAARLRDARSRAEAAELLVAVEDGLLGTVTYVPEGGPMNELAGPGEAEFRMFAVAPAAQGRGVGTALLAHVLEESRRRGLARVVCSSQATMHAAHRVYERFGFARDPSRDWSPVPGVQLLAFTLDL